MVKFNLGFFYLCEIFVLCVRNENASACRFPLTKIRQSIGGCQKSRKDAPAENRTRGLSLATTDFTTKPLALVAVVVKETQN